METDGSHLFLMHCYPCSFQFFPTKWLNNIHFYICALLVFFRQAFRICHHCPLPLFQMLTTIDRHFTPIYTVLILSMCFFQLSNWILNELWTVFDPVEWHNLCLDIIICCGKTQNQRHQPSLLKKKKKKIYKGKPEEPRMYPTHVDVWTITRVVTSHLFIWRHALWWCTLTGSPCENLVHVGLRYWCRKPCKKEKHPKDF